MGIRSTHVVWGMYPRPVLLADARFDSCGMHMGMRMAHVVWKHMGIRMNYMGMLMSGATISMAEWAALVVGPACKHYHAKRNDG